MAGTQSGTGTENLTTERMNKDADGALNAGDREPDIGANDGTKSGKRRRTHPSNGEDKDSGRAESVSRSVASTGNDLKANAPKSKEARLYWIKFTPADKTKLDAGARRKRHQDHFARLDRMRCAYTH